MRDIISQILLVTNELYVEKAEKIIEIQDMLINEMSETIKLMAEQNLMLKEMLKKLGGPDV